MLLLCVCIVILRWFKKEKEQLIFWKYIYLEMLYIYIYIYVCMYVCIYIHVCVYIYLFFLHFYVEILCSKADVSFRCCWVNRTSFLALLRNWYPGLPSPCCSCVPTPFIEDEQHSVAVASCPAGEGYQGFSYDIIPSLLTVTSKDLHVPLIDLS